MVTFSLEFAKTARSSCKMCKDKIDKDLLRIGVSRMQDDHEMTSWYCLSCFRPTKGQIKEYGSVEELIEATTVNVETVPDRYMGDQDWTALLTTNMTAPKPAKVKPASSPAATGSAPQSTGSGGSPQRVEKLKAALQPDGAKLSKKVKIDFDDLAAEAGVDAGELENYSKFSSMTADGLKDYFRWNDCTVGGSKDELIARAVDLAKYGRPKRCGTCSGTLKLDADAGSFTCGGGFDEAVGARMDCGIRYPCDTAPRLDFITERPTDDEKDAMKEANKAKDGDDALADKVALKAEKVDEIDLSSNAGKKEAAVTLLAACRSMKVKDIPADDQAAKIKIGGFIQMACAAGDESVNAILTMIVNKQGVEKNETETKAAEQRAADTCANAKNGGMWQMLSELSMHYFKEKNANAGATYRKAANAIKEVTWEIDEAAIKASQKKTDPHNIDGVGKGTADKLKEFLKTGTCEKLEEKRAAAAS